MNRLLVPAGEGRALRVATGATFAVVDVEGGQVGDLFAFSSADIREYASAEHTRPAIGRLFPRPGQEILTNQRRPILELLDDTSPGFHDTLYAACDPARYRLLGVTGEHRSCAQNLGESLAVLGFVDVPVPQPFNVFMDVRVAADGVLAVHPASSAAGDHLAFRAVMDCIVVLSSCPMDIRQISTGEISPLAFDLPE